MSRNTLSKPLTILPRPFKSKWMKRQGRLKGNGTREKFKTIGKGFSFGQLLFSCSFKAFSRIDLFSKVRRYYYRLNGEEKKEHHGNTRPRTRHACKGIFARHSRILSHRRRSARVCRMARESQANTIE